MFRLHLHEYSRKFSVSLHAWVFMTNHVHLLASPHKIDGISNMMQSVGRCYVRYFNREYRRSGTLWEGRFKSSLVQSETYLLQCQRYIELNPVRAGMVSDPAQYAWSSYQCHSLGKAVKMSTPHEVYLALGNTDSIRQSVYRSLFRAHVDDELIKDIRVAVNKGLALGGERFKEEIERLTNRRINIDTQSLKTYSAIIQLSKNEEVVLIDLIEACDHAVLCETVSFTLSRQ